MSAEMQRLIWNLPLNVAHVLMGVTFQPDGGAIAIQSRDGRVFGILDSEGRVRWAEELPFLSAGLERRDAETLANELTLLAMLKARRLNRKKHRLAAVNARDQLRLPFHLTPCR